MRTRTKSPMYASDFKRIPPGSELGKRLTREQLLINELYDQYRKGYMDTADFRRILQSTTSGR